jgi:metallo-beta-lactamase class B
MSQHWIALGKTPVSRDGFRFSNSDAYPTAVADLQRGFAILEQLPCDVLVKPHPDASSLWDGPRPARKAS